MSSKSEAFGRVIVEALKAGLRVLVRNSGGAPESVNSSNGLLYNSHAELAAVLSGDIKFPEGEIIMNYSEAQQLNELKQMLSVML